MTSQTADSTAASTATGAEQAKEAAGDVRLDAVQSDDMPAVSKVSISTDRAEKRSSTDDAANDAPSIVVAPTDDGEMTPPLPNGEKRLHPLFDEDKIAIEAAALSNDAGKTSPERTTKAHPKALRLLDTMASEQGYPSPSGGFVPPVTEEGWVLNAPPAARGAGATPASAPPTVTSTNTTPSASKTEDRLSTSPNSSAALFDETHVDRPVRPPSIPSSQSTSERIRAAGAGSGTGSRRASFVGNTSQPTGSRSTDSALTAANIGTHAEGAAAGPSELRRVHSTSSDRSSLLGGKAESQAISARSSPSTTAPARRRSSASVDVHHSASAEDAALDALLPPLKVRDYAYTELDPRHVGARDVGLPSVDEQENSDDDDGMGRPGRVTLGLGKGGGGGDWGRGADDDDDEEGYDDSDDDEDDAYHDGNLAGDDMVSINSSASQSGLPIGLYHAAYDFNAESEHELDVKVGQRVRLIGHVDGGWAIVVRVPEGQSDVAPDEEHVDKGLVPEAYLEWLTE